MTQHRSVNERINAWLVQEAPEQLPDRVLRATFERTRSTRQHRTLLGWRHATMVRAGAAAIAVGAAAIVVATIALGPRSTPSVGAGASPTPSATPSGRATSSARPTSSPTPPLAPISLTGQIAFERTVDRNTDIYMMNLDRSGLVRLTDDPATDHQATWTPDGKLLIFSRETSSEPEMSDIYALDVESGIETRLTDAPGRDAEPRVSRDGTRIAYDSAPAEPGLHVMDVDGSNKRFVLRFPADQDSLIGWSADGGALYYVHAGFDILRVDVSGGDPVPVVIDGDHANVSVSPDSSAFAFQSDRAPGGNFVMDVDGSNVRHVTGSGTEGWPVAWAPTGDRLVYNDPSHWLYLVRTDGSEVMRWTQGDAPAWRPTR